MLNDKDKQLLEKKGITEEMLEEQLARFASGFPVLEIKSVATVGNGIVRLDPKDEGRYLKSWRLFREGGGTVEKFVPASGAASRMFKNIFAFVGSGRQQAETPFEKEFIEHLDKFAFYAPLDKACQRMYGKSIRDLLAEERHADIANAMLSKDGLNYGFLPKALLKFHRAVAGQVHTALEEHLEEGAQYAADNNRRVNLHFTVSPEHRAEFGKLLNEKLPNAERVWGVKYSVTMSEQKSKTDTVAVMADNTPYRDAEGNLLFRPAGHGALLENLNEREADVIFVKNIDNVVPMKLRNTTVRWKKIIGGYLVDLQRAVARQLAVLDGKPSSADLRNVLAFVENSLFTTSEKTASMSDEELAAYLRGKLERPLRVCGVVRNEGEPGGGPYIAKNPDGSYSPQILEEAQIDHDNPAAIEMMNSGTHFNPVDLVCYIKDTKGNKFDLKKYVDKDTGLISLKSKDGVEIKALELPGLWNGSMSDWNTVMVEVPIETFNPVKTVNDLLRPQHQA